MGFSYSRIAVAQTTLKQNLQMSRALPDQIYDSTETENIYEDLFSSKFTNFCYTNY